MPARNLIGDENGVAQIVTKQYIGDDNGIAQEIVKVYIGDDNGIAQLCYSGADFAVNITGLSSKLYCEINGTTYDSGDVSLNLPTGTPIVLYFDKEFTGVKCATVNGGSQIDCDEIRYVVTGNVNISCKKTETALSARYTAIIKEDVPSAACFTMMTRWNTDEITRECFCYRNGMTWRKFVESMYNNGDFMKTSGKNTVSYRTNGRTVNLPADSTYTSGNAVSLDETIYNGKTYI